MTQSGIYQIKNIINGKKYIGSSVSINTRKRGHFRDLIKKKHHSILLQRAWNKYGSDKFEFSIIEILDDREKLIEREQYYLDTLDPEYNISKVAGSTLGLKCSEKTKNLISKANKGNKYALGHIVSIESRKVMSEAKKGKRNWRASLSTNDVIKIRKMRYKRKTYKEIGNKYCVSLFVIRDIIKGKTYKYVS